MVSDYPASAEVDIAAPSDRVWEALTEPALIKQYMFGADVVTSWKPGEPIIWRGEYEGRRYEDKGEVLEVITKDRLRFSHFSPLTGKEDAPENYHTVTYQLSELDGVTHVTLTQDGSSSPEEAQASSKNWQMMLDSLRSVLV